MKILVCSCDKNEDTFYPFHHCMEKYWPNHPEVIYKTETIQNPYYKTIAINYDISQWTRGIRETLNRIDDNIIIWMMDDCFIRHPVDIQRVQFTADHLTGNIANFNYEKAFDSNDEYTSLPGFKKRRHGSEYEVSIMCGIWDKQKLLRILLPDSDPWTVEYSQNNCGYDFYINSGEYIIDWGYKTYQYAGIVKGKWCKEVVPFFKSEGITVDYSRREFEE